MESKEKFFIKIEEHYRELSEDIIPKELLSDLVLKVVDNQYKFYKNCLEKYPKSRKRYSKFKISDLENPHVYFLIINFFENNKSLLNDLEKKYCKILFKMDNKEFDKFLEYKNWYDTK